MPKQPSKTSKSKGGKKSLKSTKETKYKESKKTIEEMYQKKSPREHVLLRPDMYIGSVEMNDASMWILNDEGRFTLKKISYVPGFFKIFDEILVNARDRTVVDKTCNVIKININEDDNTISVWNNGEGIPVVIHKEHKIYVPELIFGHLRTSTNYTDEKKTTGGKNGLGAKAVNCFSKEFTIETVDSDRKKQYKQVFTDNMSVLNKPKIKDYNDKSYTQITFKPDLLRFKMNEFSSDVANLFRRRVYDLAAVTSKKIKIYLDGKKLNINSFDEYIKLYYPEEDEENKLPLVYEKVNDRWEVGLVYDSSSGFRQMSFVNGINTFMGGSHVDHVVNRIVSGIIDHIAIKHKDIIVKPAYVKDNINIFVNAIIEDPVFDSQSKATLGSKVSSFGSKCDLDKKFIDAVCKTGIVDEAVDFAKLKAAASLKKTDGKKVGSLRNLEKLQDANWAGKRKAKYCKLFLTEGDSARKFVVDGLDIVGRDRYGVFPLRGKPLNVREAGLKQINNNTEFANIKKIMGLKNSCHYSQPKDFDSLRYGGIIIVSDQDVDGFHIKGLIMNMFHHFWPNLIKKEGFITAMNTPILKVFKKNDKKEDYPICFDSIRECRMWEEEHKKKNVLHLYHKPQYYKGLGSHSDKEARQIFEEFEKRVVKYQWETDKLPESNENNEGNKNNEDSGNNEEDDIEEEDDNEEEEQEDEKSKGSKSNSKDEDAYMEELLKNKQSLSHKAFVDFFDKKKSNERKHKIQHFNPDDVIEPGATSVPYSYFLNKEMILFSREDVERSIPNIADNFKPSQRKILYGAYRRGLNSAQSKPIKVSQLAGFVSDVSQYHHGEASLQGAIVGMAQDYIGSNNVNILLPKGNFGTRMTGGKDAASARYIFTKFGDMTNYLFRKEDLPILKHVTEDGETVEPEIYAPIIPMSLVNGSSGIGTGFSTDIPSFNPLDIVYNLKAKMNGKKLKELYPWYFSFKGNVGKDSKERFYSEGKFEVMNDSKIRITEIPVGIWIEKYKNFIESFIPDGKENAKEKKIKIVKDYKNYSGNYSVNFEVEFIGTNLKKLLKADDGIIKKFNLRKPIATSNMWLYLWDGSLKKFKTANDILEEFYNYRHEAYVVRKKHIIDDLSYELEKLKDKRLYISLRTKKKLEIEEKSEEKIEILFKKAGIRKFGKNYQTPIEDQSYDFILNMTQRTVSKEKIADLDKQIKDLEDKLRVYKKRTVEEIWTEELDEFVTNYKKWIKNKEEELTKADSQKSKNKDNKKKGGKSKKKKNSNEKSIKL